VKGFEDAGDVEKPARRTKAAKQNRSWPDMKTPGVGPRQRMTFSRDLGRNATQIRRRGGIIRARNGEIRVCFFSLFALPWAAWHFRSPHYVFLSPARFRVELFYDRLFEIAPNVRLLTDIAPRLAGEFVPDGVVLHPALERKGVPARRERHTIGNSSMGFHISSVSLRLHVTKVDPASSQTYGCERTKEKGHVEMVFAAANRRFRANLEL
jgi:hypothetical protein